jgi:hypothetical protein
VDRQTDKTKLIGAFTTLFERGQKFIAVNRTLPWFQFKELLGTNNSILSLLGVEIHYVPAINIHYMTLVTVSKKACDNRDLGNQG